MTELSKSADNITQECDHKCEICQKIDKEYDNIIIGFNELIEEYNKLLNEYVKRHPDEVKELDLYEVEQIIKENFSN